MVPWEWVYFGHEFRDRKDVWFGELSDTHCPTIMKTRVQTLGCRVWEPSPNMFEYLICSWWCCIRVKRVEYIGDIALEQVCYLEWTLNVYNLPISPVLSAWMWVKHKQPGPVPTATVLCHGFSIMKNLCLWKLKLNWGLSFSCSWYVITATEKLLIHIPSIHINAKHTGRCL